MALLFSIACDCLSHTYIYNKIGLNQKISFANGWLNLPLPIINLELTGLLVNGTLDDVLNYQETVEKIELVTDRIIWPNKKNYAINSSM